MSADALLHETEPAFAGELGFAREDMTPEPGIYCHNWGAARHEVAASIHRPLYVYALAARDPSSGSRAVIVTLDYSWFRFHRTLESLRQPLLAAHGLDDSELLISVTHSHSVPHIESDLEEKPGGDKIPAYRTKLLGALDRAIRGALAALSPGILTWASGTCGLARRRSVTHPASGQILCGPNPNDTADATLLVGRVTDLKGHVRGTLVNYACHPVSLGAGNTTVSPDYVGALRSEVERHTGEAPCMFIHGASGDQTPRDSYAADPAVADRNGEVVAFAALSILKGMLPPARRLEFAHTQASGAPLAIFEARAYAPSTVLRSAVVRPQLVPRQWPSIEELKEQLAATKDSVERVRLSRLMVYIENMDALKAGFPIWVVRLGSAFIVATPAEPFTTLQVELRARFGGKALVVANDTNGSFNYLPPRDYYGNGAYEQDSADFGPGSLELVVDAAAAMIRDLDE